MMVMARGRAWARGVLLAAATAILLASCAAPPLKLYTLSDPPVGPVTARPGPPSRAGLALGSRPQLGAEPTVVEIARVTVPDELDTEDIFVRDGSTLRRSSRGRWATRLSVGVTDRLTGRLAARRPGALVTDRPQAQAPSYRVLINVSRLDVTTQAGAVPAGATLEADWLIVPRDAALPTQRDRARFVVTGPVETDQDVATLTGILLDKLAGAINISSLR